MAMFGVRIWFTPMNNVSSPAASFRFAWFSPTLFGIAGFLPLELAGFGRPEPAPALPRPALGATFVSGPPRLKIAKIFTPAKAGAYAEQQGRRRAAGSALRFSKLLSRVRQTASLSPSPSGIARW